MCKQAKRGAVYGHAHSILYDSYFEKHSYRHLLSHVINQGSGLCLDALKGIWLCKAQDICCILVAHWWEQSWMEKSVGGRHMVVWCSFLTSISMSKTYVKNHIRQFINFTVCKFSTNICLILKDISLITSVFFIFLIIW